MEFNDSINQLEAFWPLTSEYDALEPFVLHPGEYQNVAAPVDNDQHQEAAFRSSSHLLDEVLQFDEQFLNETPSSWLDERMDMDIFHQSVNEFALQVEEPTRAPKLDHFWMTENSPVPSTSTTPIYPLSPSMHQSNTELDKEESEKPLLLTAEEESRAILEKFEELLNQIDPLELPCSPRQDLVATSQVNSPSANASDAFDVDKSNIVDQVLEGELQNETVFIDIPDFSVELSDDLKATAPSQPEDFIHNNEEPSTQPEETSISEAADCYIVVESRCNDANRISDVEWMPEPPSKRRKTSQPSTSAKKSPNASMANEPRRARKKAMPVETKKLRKKEQNKTAATRYRCKKKAELEILLDEETRLTQKNIELKKKFGKMSEEITYLKNLLREVCVARGILK